METEKVKDLEQTVTEDGGDDQLEVEGGDSPGTSVTDETVNEEKVVPLETLRAVESKYKSEKEAREASERAFNELNMRLSEIERRSQPQQPDPFDGRDEYEPITVGEFKKLTAQQQEQYTQILQSRFIAESANRAREKHSSDPLTYEKALSIFSSSKYTDAERAAVLSSSDPGETMWKYVKATSDEVDDTKSAKELAAQITGNVNQAKTLSSASKTSSKTLNKLKELQKMTPQEIGRMLDEQARNKGG